MFRLTSFLDRYVFSLILDSAFYDGSVTANNTGNFVFSTVVPDLKAACPGKKIMITECAHPIRHLFVLNFDYRLQIRMAIAWISLRSGSGFYRQ